ncbi:MAG: UDP-2,3-diacylglucosamine diphosphatase LpxI [Verrucomicrobia bacterium]|nr:UDP-2,3-diacylglucosamine diphosphatase LpxI [Verrucomicrobiota bacterium]
MRADIPESIGLIAGRGVYPRLLAESARTQGVKRIFAVAFKKETDSVINKCADEVKWLNLGKLGAMIEAFTEAGIKDVVMVGQITPTHLFRVRMDKAMLSLLAGLPQRNAHTIFGAIGDELKKVGVELQPAYLFMESSMPAAGTLGKRAPTDRERQDIEIGRNVAKTTSGLEIGQTVVIKEGTILAVEAFEGTDDTIKRAGKLGGPGSVVVKVAKRGHDMRFDIPVIGLRTMKSLAKARASALAVEAGRTILLEREAVIAEADRLNICLIAFEAKETSNIEHRTSNIES